MKKIVILFTFVLTCVLGANAQKYAYVDTQYILDNIPAYHSAQEQLNQVSQNYQKELEAVRSEIEQMYQDFRAESVLLSDDMKKRREDVIISKEKELRNLQRKYFGNDGDLFKKRQALIQPLQEEISGAIQQIAEKGDYAVIFDKSGAMSMVYANPKYNLSDKVLENLGYKN